MARVDEDSILFRMKIYVCFYRHIIINSTDACHVVLVLAELRIVRWRPFPSAGLLVLIPIYVNGGNDNPGASRLSLANVEDGGQALWAGVVFAWFFTLYFLYSLRKEFLA